MMVLDLKAVIICALLIAVVEPAKLPRKAIGKEIPVLKALKSERFRSSHNLADANATVFSLEEQTVEIMKKIYERPSLVSVSFHPNLSIVRTPTPHSMERQRMKRNPQECIPAPTVRCEKNRIPNCLTNVGCKGAGSCGGTCREVRISVPVLKYIGVSNGQSIWQPDFIVVSADCACS